MPLAHANKHIEDPEVQLARLGPITRHTDVHDRCVETAIKVRGWLPDDVKIQYDIHYGGHPHELRYTEVFARLGGIMVVPCCHIALRLMYQQALVEAGPATHNMAAWIVDNMGDKYVQLNWERAPVKEVVILPGSNLLETAIDKKKLNQAHRNGAWVKPHPLTVQRHMERLEAEYGSRLFPKAYSGWKAMKGAEVVYTGLGSELGLCAELMGKEVRNIASERPAGGYVDLHQFVRGQPKRAEYFNRLLNNPMCGIFWPHSTQEDVDAFVAGWRYIADLVRS